MENWPKDKLLSEIQKLKKDTKYLQTKLRDVISAYKRLSNEKEALESGLKAFQNVCKSNADSPDSSQKQDGSDSSSTQDDERNFQQELNALMSSIQALTTEKNHMEASYQAEKKILRQEKDRFEVMVRDLQDKLRINSLESATEIEQLKSSLIIEKHEREKEQHKLQSTIRDLEKHLSQEREDKVVLERTLSDLTSKEEFERYKEVDIAEKFVNLQKKHMVALEQERRKTIELEIELKNTERCYEERVAVLENRLAELSNTLVIYNRSRQQDQKEIVKLKNQVGELSVTASVSVSVHHSSTQTENDGVELNNDNALYQDNFYYEDENMFGTKYGKSSNIDYDVSSPNLLDKIDTIKSQENQKELENLKIKVRMLTDQNSLLTDQLDKTINRYERQLEELREQYMSLCLKYEEELQAIEMKYKLQIIELEVQVQKQRDRTLALLEEKEQEVSTLKSSFQMFVPGNSSSIQFPLDSKNYPFQVSQLDEVLSDMSTQGNSENPHILHYAHELARKDVVITGLRKNCCQLENSLRELKKELIVQRQANLDQVAILNKQINRLESCQSREGANLEYLKNIFVNYLHTKDNKSKRHMLNAIAAVLKLTDAEINKIITK